MRFRRSIARTLFGARWTSEIAALVALVLTGCNGLEPVTTYQQTTDPAELFMALTLDHPAVNLATATPYDTLQLTATPRNALGEPMSGLPAPTFRLAQPTDSILVTVTPTGLVTAKAATPGVTVIAELRTSQNVLQADTAIVAVTTDPPPVLDRLSIHPVPPDSAIWSLTVGTSIGQLYLSLLVRIIPFYSGAQLTPVALDATGNPIPGLTIEYVSLDPTVAVVNRWLGFVSLIHQGQARLVARTTAYGVTKVDTATFTVTMPVVQDVFVQPSGAFEPSEIRIVPHGFVFWRIFSHSESAVTFEDPTNVAEPTAAVCDWFAANASPDEYCGTGGFVMPALPDPDPTFGIGIIRIRQFHVPGVYTYHSATGATGRIIVGAD